MYIEKLILETDEHGFFKQKLNLPPNSTVEAIFLVLKKQRKEKRNPSVEIAGKATLIGLDTTISDLNNEEDMIGWLLEHPLEVINGDAKPLTRDEIYSRQEQPRKKITVHTFHGDGLKPGINLNNSSELQDALDEDRIA